MEAECLIMSHCGMEREEGMKGQMGRKSWKKQQPEKKDVPYYLLLPVRL